MTASANRLTARANGSPFALGAEPTAIRAGPIRPLLSALGQLGYDVEALLAAAGVAPGELEDPEAWIPCDVLPRVLGGAMRQRFTPNIAARMAALTPIGTYPLLDYLILTCDTVAEGARQLARFFPLIGAPAELIVREDESPIRVSVRSSDPFTMEFAVAIMVHHFRRETDNRLRVAFASLTHTPDDIDALEKQLGCPVQAPDAWCGLALPKESWPLPMRRRDPVLKRVLEGHAEDVTAREPVGVDDSLSERVRRVLTSTLGRGEPNIAAVSRTLAVAPRTLQRRLAEEDVSFNALIDETRREAAERLLADASLAVAEIAYLLGFSEPSAFHRAFRRWTGAAPSAFRLRHRPT